MRKKRRSRSSAFPSLRLAPWTCAQAEGGHHLAVVVGRCLRSAALASCMPALVAVREPSTHRYFAYQPAGTASLEWFGRRFVVHCAF